MIDDLPPYNFHGELRGMLAGPADEHTPRGTRVVKVRVGIVFNEDGAQVRIESATQIAESVTTQLELPAELAAQLLAVLLHPRSSPVTGREIAASVEEAEEGPSGEVGN